jgi:DNA-binding helix-hairpin-helix protein with protein kinase domain
VALGAELGRGGEGAVYDVPARPGSAAKIYLKPPDRLKADKIKVMVDMATDRLTALAAWPTATLYTTGGILAGFEMPKLAGHRPVYQAYGPKLRLREFPKADWRFLVHTAGNVARAFRSMHAAGLVIGDVNHGNLFVAADATIRFIDTDSFQVTAGTRRWPCEVGVGTHQPPEMQGLASYRDVIRTPNHDNFGLAVLIFQLLCMGRHPFAGRFSGAGEPPDIERAITESRYAYSADTARTQMAPPPGSLAMTALPPSLRGLFEDAFAPGAVNGGRPAPERWTAELDALGKSLQKCAVNAAHWYAPDAGACPWCEVEARSGTVLFPAVFVPGQPGIGAALLWQQIEALKEPPRLPELRRPAKGDAVPAPAIVAAAKRVRRRRISAALLFALGPLLVYMTLAPDDRLLPLIFFAAAAAAVWFFPGPREREEVRANLADASRHWADLETRWRAADATTFGQERQKLLAVKREYDTLPAERERRMALLAADRRQQQLVAHLEGFAVAAGKIAGVGKARVTVLLSYGIETAADFDQARLAAFQGFGPRTIANMLEYRKQCEASFQFDPARAVAASEVAKLDRDIGQRRARLEAELATGLARLRAVSESAILQRAALEARAAELRPVLAQALADADALGLAE